MASNKPIYADQAATSFPKPREVVEAVNRALTEHSASPGRSAHRYSLLASRAVFEARESMAALLGVDDSSRIAFTLNVTQALNTALGLLNRGDKVLTTSMEHNSVMRPLTWRKQVNGIETDVVEASEDGRLDPVDFAKKINDGGVKLVVVNHASNVTGTIAPVIDIKNAIGETLLLVDAAQSAGSLRLDELARHADVIAFTGHKGLLGPTGTGGLWIRPGLEIPSLLQGGTGSRSEFESHPDFMPDALEAGTPNTHGLAGLGAGIDFVLETGVEKIRNHEVHLMKRFLNDLESIKNVVVYGPKKPDETVAVASLNLKGWSPSDLAMTLDREFGIMTRPGLHCAPQAHRTINTFPAGTVRFSFGWFNGENDVERIISALDALSVRAR